MIMKKEEGLMLPLKEEGSTAMICPRPPLSSSPSYNTSKRDCYQLSTYIFICTFLRNFFQTSVWMKSQ